MHSLTSDQLIHLLETHIQQSGNSPGSTLAENRIQATNYYLGRITGRETGAGLSDQISGDVADMVDATCAETCVSLLASDMPVEIEPQGDDDRLPARLETAVVNRVIMDQNHGYENLQAAVQSAALYKVGIIAVEAQETEKPRSRYVGMVEGDQKRVIEGETGGTIDKDGMLTWIETQKRVIHRVVAPENWYTEAEYPGFSLDEASFVAERRYYTRGALVALGYKWKDVRELMTKLPGTEDGTQERQPAKNEQHRPRTTDELELIETFWCYVRLPEKDHSLRLYKVHMAENVILDQEPCDFIPYAIGTMIPFVGRSTGGVSLHDRIKPIEDGRTYALRQWEDNLAYGNNAELVLGSTAQEEDAKERIPGGYLRAQVVADIAALPV